MYRRIKQILCCTLLLGSSISAHALSASTELKPFRALYESKLDVGVELALDAVRELRQNANGHWILTSTAEAVIAGIEESSRFTQIGRAHV